MSMPENERVVYSEKLYPSLGLWMFVVFLGGATLLALLPVNVPTGIISAIAVMVVVGALLVGFAPTIQVTKEGFQAGRAHIEHRFLAEPRGFDGDAAVAQRGVELNGLAYLCIRGWVSPVVRVSVNDPNDSTPYWLVSTRRPQELVATLITAGEQVRSTS